MPEVRWQEGVAIKPISKISATSSAVEAVVGMYCGMLQEHLYTCNVLEAIADSLPHSIDKHSCMLIAKRLPPRMRTVHTVENEVIYPVLRSPRCAAPMSFDLDRLQAEHQTDQDYAEEVCDMLMLIASGETYHREHAGYLLRGFFQSSRRHVGLDLEFLVPLAQPLLEPSDVDLMRQIIAREQTLHAIS